VNLLASLPWLFFMATLCNRAGHIYFHPVVSSFFLWPPWVADADIIFLFCLFFFYSLFFSSPDLSGQRLDVWCGLSVNLECRSETCCVRLAENTGHKKSPKGRHLGTIPQLCRAISSQLRHVLSKSDMNMSVDKLQNCLSTVHLWFSQNGYQPWEVRGGACALVNSRLDYANSVL